MEHKQMRFTKEGVFEHLTEEQIRLAGRENISRWIDESAFPDENGSYVYNYLKFPAASDEESFLAWLFYPIDVPRELETEMIDNSQFPKEIEIGQLRDSKETLSRLALACTLKNPYACKVLRKFFKSEAKSYKEKAKAYKKYLEEGKPIENEEWNPVYPLALFGLGALTGAALYGVADHHHHRRY